MTSKTNIPDLIDELVAGAEPVRRLRPPLLRALAWLGFAAAIGTLLVAGHGLRADLALRLDEPVFVASVVGALATAIFAACAAFEASLPDRSRWWLLLPAPPLLLWLSTVGYGCLTDWVSIGPDGIRPGETLQCFTIVVFASVPAAIALAVMLRYVALLRSPGVALVAALAVAAFSSATLALVHDHNATVLVLLENLGLAALITALGGLFGDVLIRFASRFEITPATGRP